MKRDDEMKKRDYWAWWGFALIFGFAIFVLADWLIFKTFFWR